MRQIMLDTETTGLSAEEGHRLVEIGCIELVNRRLTSNHFHQYVQPEREIDPEACKVHGITNEFLQDKPRFAEIAEAMLEYLKESEILIHNAAFDESFLNAELKRLDIDWQAFKAQYHIKIIDTLTLARRLHPGQKNNLDALCKRYNIDNSHRTLHGALLDAEILAEVYLAMTGGQTSLLGSAQQSETKQENTEIKRLDSQRPPLPIICADETELAAHQKVLALLEKASGGNCLWKQVETATETEKT